MSYYDRNIVSLLRQRAIEHSDKLAYAFLKDGISISSSLTYGELDRKARAIAATLQSQVSPGSRALLAYSSSEEFLPAFFGCLYARIIAVPTPAIDAVRMKRSLPRIKAIAEDSQAATILTTSKLASQLKEIQIQIVQLRSAQLLVTDAIDLKNGSELEATINSQDLAYLQYTSGSTSTPKGAMISHENLMDNLGSIITNTYGYDEQSIVANWMPYFHDYALVMHLIHPLYAGITCYLMSPIAFIKRPIRWLKAISRYRVTHSGAPNFAYDYCVSQIKIEQLAQIDLSSWRVAHTGAETIRYKTLQKFEQTFQACGFDPNAFYPSYGLAEATLIVTAKNQQGKPAFLTVGTDDLIENKVTKISPAQNEIKTQVLTGCGYPAGSTKVVIINPRTLTRCAADEVGEIWVSGKSVAQGYWHRPEETQQTFQANLPDIPDTSFLRTGDLGFLKDGQLFVTGRLKDLIVIRGKNYYPQDIEFTVEKSHFQLRANSSAVFSINVEEVEKLVVVAEINSRGDKNLPADEIVEAISHGVAQDHELPIYKVVLLRRGSISKTSSGKIQRHACRRKFIENKLDPIFNVRIRENQENFYVAPTTPTEKKLAKIWSQVLCLKQKVGVHNNFFDLGGNSLLATQIMSRIHETLKVELPLRSLFAAPNIEQLAQQVNAATSKNLAPIVSVSRNSDLPLSFSQQRLWFLDRLEGKNITYNLPTALRLIGSLNVGALEQAIASTIKRHETLRTNFSSINGSPVQIINSTRKFTLSVVKVKQSEEVEKLIDQEKLKPFNLERDSLIRVKLLRLNSTEHVLSIVMHHIISDGWSLGILSKELTALYSAFCAGTSPSIAKLPIQYADFAAWQQERFTPEVLETQQAYWIKQLQGAPPLLELPTDRPRPTVQTFTGKRESRILSPKLSQSLITLSQEEGVTLFMTLLTSFKILLSRWSGSEDIVVGTPVAGRNRPELEPLIGFFINTLVLRTHLGDSPSFRSLLGRVKEVALGAFEHQEMPFEKLVDSLQPARSLSHTPLFQVWFNMLNLENNPPELPGLTVETISQSDVASKFDLTLYVQETDSGIKLDLVYNADLFAPSRMVEMLAQLEHLLWQVVAEPNQAIAEVSLVTPQAQSILPNPTEKLSCELFTTFHTRFDQQAKRIPEQLAVVDKSIAWSYAELSDRTNQLANYLRVNGICDRDVVAIIGDRSACLVWAILGVIKAGAAFMILDPAYPTASLIHRLQLGNPRALLHLTEDPLDRELLTTINQLCCRVLQITPELKLAGISTDAPLTEINPDDIAYVAFTSGSTGFPKGIQAAQRPLSHFLQWHTKTFDLFDSDRFIMLSGLAHDPLLRDIFTPLWLGATLYIPDQEDIENPSQLACWMQQNQVSIVHLTPSMAKLLGETTIGIDTLRYVFSGGDVLTQDHVAKLGSLAPGAKIVNFYGATETPQAIGYFPIPDNLDKLQNIKDTFPLGKGIDRTQLLVLNKNKLLAGIGEVGEIYVRTPYLALGYLDNDQLTVERFILNPFTKIQEVPSRSQALLDRLYRTGDLARYLPDGNLEFIGRVDCQVKIRGFRIEPGEIESTLKQHSHVEESIVLATEGVPDDARLIAYVVTTQAIVPSLDELRSFLKQKLPKYMLPAAIVPVDTIPLTPNGKVDRHLLASANIVRQTPAENYVAPTTPAERKLAKIWSEVLWLEKKVGIHDNFFDLGGHSLLSIRLVTEIEQVFQRKLPVAAIFELSTIAELATILDKELSSAAEPSELATSQLSSEIYHQLVAYTAGWKGKRVTPTSLIAGMNTQGSKQSIFWCLQGFRELSQLAKYLGEDQPIYGMRSGHLIMKYTLENIKALAACYVSEILSVQPESPYLLGGNCQSAWIIREIAQQLIGKGKTITLLCLMEQFVPQTYPSRTAFFFGRDSQFNPYKFFSAPELGYRKFYREFSVNVCPVEHGHFFSEPNIQMLTRQLAVEIEKAQSESVSPQLNPEQYQLLPPQAYNAKLSTEKSVDIIAEESLTISVRVENISTVTWKETDRSSIRLGNHWLDTEGAVICWRDGIANLYQDLSPQTAVNLCLKVTAPEKPGSYKLELDLVEEGVTWFKDKGSQTFVVEVKVLPLKENTLMAISPYGFPELKGDRHKIEFPFPKLKKLTPQFIGATGGSGSRVVAKIVQKGGMFIGNKRNHSEDSLEMIEYLSSKKITANWNSHISAESYAQIIDKLENGLEDYLAGLDSISQAQLWGWKIPPSIFLLPFLHAQFPKIKCLHLIRDGRDMAYFDNQNQLRYLGPLLLNSEELSWKKPLQSIALWNKLNLLTAEYGEKHLPSQYLQVRFEDLCLQPVSTIERIFKFFGLAGDIERIARTEISTPKSLGHWQNRNLETIGELNKIGAIGLKKFGYLETSDRQQFGNQKQTNITFDRHHPKFYIQEGDFYFEKGDLKSAIASYQNAIKLTPQLPIRIYHKLGIALSEQEEFAAAIIAYQKALELEVNNAELYFLLAKAQSQQGNLPAAAIYYHKAIELKPKHSWFYKDLGLVLKQLNRLEEAIDIYLQAIELDDRNPVLHFQLGSTQIKAGKTEMGVASYAAAIELNPDYAEFYTKRQGDDLYQQGDVEAAISAYHRSLAINSRQDKVHKALGKALSQLNKIEDAIASYQKAIALNPENPAVYNSLGNAQRQLGDCEGAISSYSRSLELNSQQFNTYIALGNTLSQVSQTAEAIKVYTKAMELNPNNPGVYNTLGNAQLKSGDIFKAIVSYQKAIELNPQPSFKVYQNLGDCLSQQGLVQDAIASYQEALKLKPNHEAILKRLNNLEQMREISTQDPHLNRTQLLREKIDVVCILGMHRSGTSCLTGSLQAAGIPGGKVNQYTTDNPRGNRENQSIMTLNDRVMADNNGTWDCPPTTLNYSLEHQQQRDLLLEELNSQFPVWMFKDPRTVLTLPFWQQGISNLQLIGTFRHPVKVAMSLYQRQGTPIPLREGLKLWIHYNSLILKVFRESPFPLICFDLPQREYLAKITEVINELNAKIADDFQLSGSKAAEFYESTLINQANTSVMSSSAEDIQLLIQAESIYQELRLKAGLEVHSKTAQDRVLLVPLEDSSAAYRQAIKAQPHNSQLYFMLAKAQHGKGNLEGAIASSKKALKLEPDSINIVEQLSKLLVEARQASEAVALVRQILESQSDNPRIYLILGDLQRQQKDLEGAICTYQKIVQLIPHSINSHVHLGHLLIQNNQIEDTIFHCQQALKLHPQNFQIYFILGKAYAQQKDWQKAIICYQKAIEFNVNSSAIIYVHLASAFEQQGNNLKALTTYQSAVESQPDSVHGYIGLGNYYRQTKDWSEAIINYQKAIELNCQNAGVYFALGESWRELRNWSKAISSYQQALDLNHPNAFRIYKVLGDTLAEINQIKPAISAYQKAMKINPDHPEIKKGLQVLIKN